MVFPITCSCLDSGVEESVDVNDVLEEAPFLLGLGLDSGIDLGVSSNLHGLGLLDRGGKGNDSSNNDFLEHFV